MPGDSDRSTCRPARTWAPVVALAALAACGGESRTPADADLILELDGMQFRRSQVAEFESYLRGVDERAGRLSIVARALDHLVPLALARRELAARRAELRARAEALRRVVGDGGYPELVAKGRAAGGYRPPRSFSRHELPLPVAKWAFDETKLGQVSPVIETPQGFCLIASREILRGVTRAGDRADAFQVTFYTHSAKEFGVWLARERAAVADRVTWVHPDYAAALPPWLHPPHTEEER